MAIKRRPGATKTPPIFSHEFVIQNHADIVSCVAMVIVISLLFQLTSPLATAFIALQHNTTERKPGYFHIGILSNHISHSIQRSSDTLLDRAQRSMHCIFLFSHFDCDPCRGSRISARRKSRLPTIWSLFCLCV